MKTIIHSTIAASLLIVASSAWAQDISTTPTIDPANGQYVASGPITYANGVQLSGLDLTGLQPTGLPGNNVGDTFPAHSFFDVFVDISLPSSPPLPSTGTGTTDTIIQRQSGLGNTGSFFDVFTELDLSGLPGGAMVRIDPTTPSTGETTITDNGGGTFQIQSFFDVFTDLSLDGGNTWVPSTGPTVLTLQPAVPEPSTIIAGAAMLLPFGASALRMLRKRQSV